MNLDYYDHYNQKEMVISLYAPEDRGEFTWPKTELSAILPELSAKKGEVINSSNNLKIIVNGISVSQYGDYIMKCEGNGFVIDSEKSEDAYKAYNKNGYYLNVSLSLARELSVQLDPPIKMDVFEWPLHPLLNQLPIPKSRIGHVNEEQTKRFEILIGNTTREDFVQYVDECIKKGFDKGFVIRRDNYYNADHYYDEEEQKTEYLTLEYIGFNTMKIKIWRW